MYYLKIVLYYNCKNMYILFDFVSKRNLHDCFKYIPNILGINPKLHKAFTLQHALQLAASLLISVGIYIHHIF